MDNIRVQVRYSGVNKRIRDVKQEFIEKILHETEYCFVQKSGLRNVFTRNKHWVEKGENEEGCEEVTPMPNDVLPPDWLKIYSRLEKKSREDEPKPKQNSDDQSRSGEGSQSGSSGTSESSAKSSSEGSESPSDIPPKSAPKEDPPKSSGKPEAQPETPSEKPLESEAPKSGKSEVPPASGVPQDQTETPIVVEADEASKKRIEAIKQHMEDMFTKLKNYTEDEIRKAYKEIEDSEEEKRKSLFDTLEAELSVMLKGKDMELSLYTPTSSSASLGESEEENNDSLPTDDHQLSSSVPPSPSPAQLKAPDLQSKGATSDDVMSMIEETTSAPPLNVRKGRSNKARKPIELQSQKTKINSIIQYRTELFNTLKDYNKKEVEVALKEIQEREELNPKDESSSDPLVSSPEGEGEVMPKAKIDAEQEKKSAEDETEEEEKKSEDIIGPQEEEEKSEDIIVAEHGDKIESEEKPAENEIENKDKPLPSPGKPSTLVAPAKRPPPERESTLVPVDTRIIDKVNKGNQDKKIYPKMTEGSITGFRKRINRGKS